jgi:hypothetical protein
MNLWAKSLRQLSFAAVALFFFSCEDENTILGFKNPVPKFNVTYVEIPLTSNFQLIDSIITDNKGGSGNMLVGRYRDNALGDIEAESYMQIYPSAATQIPDDAIFDSLTLSVRFNFYGYGFEGDRTEKFAIHQLFDSLQRSSKVRYQFNSAALAYDPTAMAVASVRVKSDTLRKQLTRSATQQDTLAARARLSDDLGINIFNLAKQYSYINTTTLSAETQIRDFLQQVRGLAFIPTESEAILGFRIFNNLSGVTLHYRTKTNGVVSDTVSRTYGFSSPSFTRIKADRTTSPLAGAVAYQSVSDFSATGKRYIQSGNPVVTKLDLSNFYSFADTVGDFLVSEAALVIDGVESTSTTLPISALCLKVMNENNQFTNYAVGMDRAVMAPYSISSNANGVLVVDGKHYVVKSDAPTQNAEVASLDYSNGAYSGYLTLFLQQLLRYRNTSAGVNENRVRYLGLYPLAPSISSSVSRTVFNAENVKLRIYYTKPTLTTTPN